ncbi:MAG: helix-turn-helix transcriptional regulator [Acetobacteraceae bacterium]|nr:helix-turn-helix transcriptional regulator [Acetobacteraceae bacterium]
MTGGRGHQDILLESNDADRRARLTRLLTALGHAVVRDAGEASLWLVDLAGEDWPPVSPAGLPALVLSDAPAVLGAAALRAVVPRGSDAERLDAAIRAAAAGLFVRAEAPGAPPGFAAAEENGPLLTPREIEVLACIGEGMSNKAVARRLGISAHTVKFHVEAVFAKLGAHSRADAVARGLRRRLIEV